MLTSNICVGSRSVSIRCPNPSPSPPPLTFPHEKVPTLQESHLDGCCDGSMCVSSGGRCVKNSFHKVHTCVFSPRCEFWSVDAIRPTCGGSRFRNIQSCWVCSPGKPPDTAWPTAKVGLVPYVPSQVSSQVWSLLVNLSAVWIVAQMHCWLSSRPILSW